MTGPAVAYRAADGVAWITLDRPAVLNAINTDLAADLADSAETAAADPDVVLVIVRGAGRAFCSGMDRTALAGGTVGEAFYRHWIRGLNRLEDMPKISAAVLHGYAIGGGLQLALACDLRIATTDAVLGLGATRHGIIPDGAVLRLARTIGLGRAKELALLNDNISPEEALAIGLVTRVCSPDHSRRRWPRSRRRRAARRPRPPRTPSGCSTSPSTATRAHASRTCSGRRTTACGRGRRRRRTRPGGTSARPCTIRAPALAVPMAPDVILETEGLTKEFRGFVAVKSVNLAVRRGSIHALIGPNGAGKTTCFNLLTHFLTPTGGRIRFKGRDITGSRPSRIARLGLVRSFQISAVFPHLSVLENVRIALQRRRGRSFDFWRSERVLEGLNTRARELIAAVGLEDFFAVPAVELPYGRKRALEIATTLALDPEMMLLDEPTAGMAHEDVARISDLIRRVAVDRTVLMVEHNLGVVENLSHAITVLSRGEIIAEGDYATVSRNPDVIQAYMGSGDA